MYNLNACQIFDGINLIRVGNKTRRRGHSTSIPLFTTFYNSPILHWTKRIKSICVFFFLDFLSRFQFPNKHTLSHAFIRGTYYNILYTVQGKRNTVSRVESETASIRNTDRAQWRPCVLYLTFRGDATALCQKNLVNRFHGRNTRAGNCVSNV